MSSIDIIVPCYRYGRYLRECVESLLNQGVEDMRVLIIDDESPDETPEVSNALARKDPRVSFRRHSKNRGHVSTYNEGIEWLAADYMLLLSADDYLLPGTLKRAMALMDANPAIGFTFGDATASLEDGALQPMVLQVEGINAADTTIMQGREFIEASARQGAINIVPTPTAVVRTALLKQLGGYDAALPHTADLELWLRLAAHSCVGHLHGAQAVYRRHSANMSLGYMRDNALRDLQQRQAALETFFERCESKFPDGKLLLNRLFEALALDSISQASIAFNNGDASLSNQICKFAQGIHPGVNRTMAWKRLAIKRLAGRKLTNLVVPALTRWRGPAVKVGGEPT